MLSNIKQSKEKLQRNKIIKNILDSCKIVIDSQIELLDVTKKTGDKGTNSQMRVYITEQEKGVWIYNSYLAK